MKNHQEILNRFLPRVPFPFCTSSPIEDTKHVFGDIKQERTQGSGDGLMFERMEENDSGIGETTFLPNRKNYMCYLRNNLLLGKVTTQTCYTVYLKVPTGVPPIQPPALSC